MSRRPLALLSPIALLACAGCIAAAAAGVVGGAWYLSSSSTRELLVDRNFDTTWQAALTVVGYRHPKQIRELRSERRIEVEDAIDIVVEIEPITTGQTRISVSARSNAGLSSDPDTAQWVAERIYQEAAR